MILSFPQIPQGERPASSGNPEVIQSAITFKPEPVPNFDTEVLVPLKKIQEADRLKAVEDARVAAEAQRLQQHAQAPKSVPAAPIAVSGNDVWARLRQCEAGGNYAINTGNGYYGAYQYDLGTWANYGGFRYPSDAPPNVQDQKARETQAARGWSPWPACKRKLGL